MEQSAETNGEATSTEDDDDIVNDLQRLAELKLSGHKRDDPQTEAIPKRQEGVVKKTRNFICNKCDLDHKTSNELEEHLDSHYEDGDFSCDTCLFQTNRMRLLRNHLLSAPGHSSGQVHGKSAIKCKFCEEKFIDKNELVNHKNMKHKTYKPCEYHKEGKCKRSPCRYSHRAIKEGYCVCYHCGKEFPEKHSLYNHRKSDHKTEVCRDFLVNNCDRQEEDCWFGHVKHASELHTKKHNRYSIQSPGFLGEPPQSSSSEAGPGYESNNREDRRYCTGDHEEIHEGDRLEQLYEQVEEANKIPVHVTNTHERTHTQSNILSQQPQRKRHITTVHRSNKAIQALSLPTVININPRSLNNKAEAFKTYIEEEEIDLAFVSESHEREEVPLVDSLQLDGFEIISNVHQRRGKGGRPALIVKKEKFHIQNITNTLITIPWGVEAVWAVLTPTKLTHDSSI